MKQSKTLGKVLLSIMVSIGFFLLMDIYMGAFGPDLFVIIILFAMLIVLALIWPDSLFAREVFTVLLFALGARKKK